ncbi:MAG TPA: hypothetical protein G4O05_05235, partial [Caldilineae bacterium]|nr:hypothetical protein [Caldilineae bacterium]
MKAAIHLSKILFLLTILLISLTGCTAARTKETPKPSPAPSPTPAPIPESPSYRVSIWAPYLGFLEQQTLTDNAGVIREVNFFWYELAADGEIKGAMQSKEGLQIAREAGMSIIPSILNGGFDRERVATIIHDPERRAAHIDAIVQLVVEHDYDGIDIDYESLYAEDREAFTTFIVDLAAALHAQDKLLSTTVHPKMREGGAWGGPQAQDWEKLGAVSDEFKIMIYDYHHGASESGPIAPL